MNEPERGKRIDRFEVVALLGKGATGTVYRARDVVAGREVALKVLLHTRLEDRQRARFQREGELTAALDHPGIVRVHSAGELSSGTPFLAYELVEGARTLGDACAAEPALARKVAWVRDAARALGFAHARGIVHRDVKPDNLLVDASGTLKVADFGAAWSSTVERLTVTGAAVGTPYFMCPEQLAGGGLPATPAWDVWSLGVTLYSILTGDYPFDGAGLEQLTMRVVASDPDAPSAKNAAVSPALEAVCLKCLEKEPDDRYADGEALAADLDRALAGQPVLARRARPRRRLTRRRLLLIALPSAALVLLLIAASLALTAAPPPTVDPPKRPVRRPPPERPTPKPVPTPVVVKPPPRPAPVDATEMARGAWELAQHDEPNSLRIVGKFYIEGTDGFPRDLPEGVRWLERGVAIDDPDCMLNLAHVLQAGGPGVPRDLARTAALTLRAAELGYRSAFKEIALAYESGNGVPTDWAKAAYWYDRHHAITAVDGDFTRPHLANMLLLGGNGLARDVPTAIKLLEESVSAGGLDSLIALATLLRDGTVVPRDVARARTLLEEAERKGMPQATVMLKSLPPP